MAICNQATADDQLSPATKTFLQGLDMQAWGELDAVMRALRSYTVMSSQMFARIRAPHSLERVLREPIHGQFINIMENYFRFRKEHKLMKRF